MKNLRLTIYLFAILFPLGLFAQYKSDSVEKNLITTIGASYQGEGNYFAEAGLMFSNHNMGLESEHDGGPRLGAEFCVNTKNFVIAPKVGYELSNILTLRVNLISYLDHQNIDLRFLPEIGFSYFPTSLSPTGTTCHS